MSCIGFVPKTQPLDTKEFLKPSGKTPEITLDHIAKHLLSYFKRFRRLKEIEKEIKKKYEIQKEDCWPVDDIIKAWEETKKMDKTLRSTKYWAFAIMLQVLQRRLGFDVSDLKEVKTCPITSDVAKEITPFEPEQEPSEIYSPFEERDNMDKVNAERKMLGNASQIPEELQNKADFPPTKRKFSERLQKDGSGQWTRGSNKSNPETVYIRIPLSVVSGNESTSMPKEVLTTSPIYKLIDRVPNLTEIRVKQSYAMLYDNRTRNAAWVYEILNKETLMERYDRRKPFEEDFSIHPFYRATESDDACTASGYEKGHLAAAANHRWCQEAYHDTFLLSNMTPQTMALNRGPWKTLEEDCRRKINESQNEVRNVHVYSGPLYLPSSDDSEVVSYEMLGDKALPTHFFKVIILEKYDGTVELECYQIPNWLSEDDTNFIVPIEYIESVSGLIFRESSFNKGETDSIRTVTWTGENENGEECTAMTQVTISTPLY
ncbi:uncharacterized protein LOC125249589 [Megalobrama amblycephala]|uniref:uncharacterized protein LOC125249589 n=1 Tax=Megalobrama amblycephala TaxID=75352 RepID=UPI002013FC7F|nr:uncharacterized protein LOC125249589 [Megalobrama amblycephala]